MVQWFEKCHQLWIHHGLQWDETKFTLAENFLNALMVSSCLNVNTFMYYHVFLNGMQEPYTVSLFLLLQGVHESCKEGIIKHLFIFISNSIYVMASIKKIIKLPNS